MRILSRISHSVSMPTSSQVCVRKSSLSPRTAPKVPEVNVVDKNGQIVKTYALPVSAHLMLEDGEEVKAGEIFVKIPRATGGAGDITGGLPRVTGTL